VKLFRATLPASIAIELELPSDAVWVLADPSQIDQVLANLATNALDAMRDNGGTLSLRLCTDGAPGPGARPEAPFATLTLSDSGPGMSEDTQRRAFDPFFTTKPPGMGTGLGLSIVHGIVEEHGGEVELASRAGVGTTFTVRLPTTIVDSEPAMAAPEARRPSSALRVLCVDDEAIVGQVLCETLRSAGHSAHCICDPREALRRVQAEPQSVDLLISDQRMPHMQGTALIEAVRALRPDLPCILITGFSDDQTLDHARKLGVRAIIAKPFRPADLLAAVERAANRR
jgi:CheY-like chemotaxis protein